jgi:large subunit ribosomal protein L34e
VIVKSDELMEPEIERKPQSTLTQVGMFNGWLISSAWTRHQIISHTSLSLSFLSSQFQIYRITMGDTRYTRSGRQPYSTKSNRVQPIRTPGGKLVAQIVTKKSKGPKCSDCKTSIQGIKHVKATEYKNMKKRERTVSRAYGGSACANCVRGRIVRAFLLEEQKAVKKVLAERQGAKK